GRGSPTGTWVTPRPWPGSCSSPSRRSPRSTSGCRSTGCSMTTDLAAAEGRAATAEGRTYRRRRHPARAAVRSGLKHAAVIALSLTMIYPLIWLVLASLKPEELIFRDASLALADL